MWPWKSGFPILTLSRYVVLCVWVLYSHLHMRMRMMRVRSGAVRAREGRPRQRRAAALHQRGAQRPARRAPAALRLCTQPTYLVYNFIYLYDTD